MDGEAPLFLPGEYVPGVGDHAAVARVEQYLLAALMAQPKLFEALPDGFGPEHFWTEGHDRFFNAVREASAHGAKVLCPLVERALPEMAAAGYVEEVRRALLLTEPRDVAGYARSLMAGARRRALADLGRELAAGAGFGEEGCEPTEALLDKAAAALDTMRAGTPGVRKAVWFDEAMDAAIAAGEDAHKHGGFSGVSTGFDPIDAFIGGMKPQRVYGLFGRPGMAKSGLLVQIAIRASRRMLDEDAKREAAGEPRLGAGIAVFSLEMDAEQIGQRGLAVGSRVDLMSLARGDFVEDTAQASAVMRTRREYAGLPILTDDDGGLSMEDIRARAKALRRDLEARGQKLRLVAIDHAHIVRFPKGFRGSEQEGVTLVSKAVKELAKELGVPVLLLGQLNRNVENREDKRPNLSDLRSSGSLEQDLDVVMFVHRPEYYARDEPARRPNEKEAEHMERVEAWRQYVEDSRGRAEIVFDKVRQGKTGIAHLMFDAECVRFYDPEERA